MKAVNMMNQMMSTGSLTCTCTFLYSLHFNPFVPTVAQTEGTFFGGLLLNHLIPSCSLGMYMYYSLTSTYSSCTSVQLLPKT